MPISIWTDLIRFTGRRGAPPARPDDDASHAVEEAQTHALQTGARERRSAASPARAADQTPVRERAVERVARVPHADVWQAPLAGASDEIARWQARALDLLSDGVLLVDGEGRVAYRNAAAAALLHGDGAPLLREARALAQTALTRGAQPHTAMADAACDLTTDAVQYRLNAVLAPAALLELGSVTAEGAPLVLVTVARGSSAFPSPAALRRRFQLTAREASVALLLAEGRSNGSIARRLGISASTTRHYTETVLLKLAVPSRSAVAAVLLGIYEHTDEHPAPGAHVAPTPARR